MERLEGVEVNQHSEQRPYLWVRILIAPSPGIGAELKNQMDG